MEETKLITQLHKRSSMQRTPGYGFVVFCYTESILWAQNHFMCGYELVLSIFNLKSVRSQSHTEEKVLNADLRTIGRRTF